MNASLDEHSLFDKLGKVTTRFPFLDVCNFLVFGIGNPFGLLHKPDSLLLSFRKSQPRHNRICQPVTPDRDNKLPAVPALFGRAKDEYFLQNRLNFSQAQGVSAVTPFESEQWTPSDKAPFQTFP